MLLVMLMSYHIIAKATLRLDSFMHVWQDKATHTERFHTKCYFIIDNNNVMEPIENYNQA